MRRVTQTVQFPDMRHVLLHSLILSLVAGCQSAHEATIYQPPLITFERFEDLTPVLRVTNLSTESVYYHGSLHHPNVEIAISDSAQWTRGYSFSCGVGDNHFYEIKPGASEEIWVGPQLSSAIFRVGVGFRSGPKDASQLWVWSEVIDSSKRR